MGLTKLRPTGTNLELSVEFFPPRTGEGISKFKDSAKKLSKLELNFASVTYGAGGSTKDGTLAIARELKSFFKEGVPHISCYGSKKKSLFELLKLYDSEGFSRLVVLRGDLPSGFGGTGEFKNAVDLVRFIRTEFGDKFKLEVAAYPEKHPQASSFLEDIKHFVEKVNAGADGAITQYFYNADSYFQFVREVKNRGVTQPIVPGIMPITNFKQLARFSDSCGAEIPRWITERLKDFGDDRKKIYQFGVEIVSKLCQQLINSGSPGLHFYSMNQAQPIIDIVSKIDLKK